MTEHLWDRKGLAGLNALRRQYGLAPLAHVFDQVRCARSQLVMTSPAFDFPATLPAGVRYVGPVLDDPLWAERWSLLPPEGCDPLVLVAMSSTFQNQIALLQRTAMRVTARGAGVSLKRSAGSSAIAAAVRRVLQTSSYRAAAQQLGDAVRRDAAGDALVRELEGIPAERDAPRVAAWGSS